MNVSVEVASSKLNHARFQLLQSADYARVSKLIWDSSALRAQNRHLGIGLQGQPIPFPPGYSKSYVRRKNQALGHTKTAMVGKKGNELKTKRWPPLPVTSNLSGRMWSYRSLGSKGMKDAHADEIATYFKGAARGRQGNESKLMDQSAKFPSAAKAVVMSKHWRLLLLGVDNAMIPGLRVIVDGGIAKAAQNLPMTEVKL